jgi:nucleoside-diphosphate-sugar epimerase
MLPQERTIGVVGASGFVGTRTVEYLALATSCRIRSVVRSYSQLSRLSELPQDRMDFVKADLLDVAGLEQAVVGCDTVIDCAYGSYGTAEQQWLTTVEGARNLVRATRVSGVERLVTLSSAAILDVAGRATFDDHSPKCNAEFPSYEHAKRVAEDIFLTEWTNTIALRPTVIYGPWGRDWTLNVLRRLSLGGRGLPSATTGLGRGISNAVYLDDVVDAVLRACVAPVTGPVLIGSADTVTWGEFYDAFRKLVPNADHAAAVVEDWEHSLYSRQARADITRARQLLGYQPRVSFSEGMKILSGWYYWFAPSAAMMANGSSTAGLLPKAQDRYADPP